MQAIKNGLKSTLRTPGKTLLFLLILTVTAALLTVSCCVFGTVLRYLDECDSYFHTIAELEYVGNAYPDPYIYDADFAAAVEKNRDALTQLIHSEAVLGWEPASAELAVSPLIHRVDREVPDPHAGVLRISILSYDEAQDVYISSVDECLYSREDKTNSLLLYSPLEDAAPPDVPGTYYVAGEYYNFSSGFPCFRAEACSYSKDGSLVEVPSMLSTEASAEELAPVLEYAERLHIKNDGCRVTCTSALEDLYPIHQQVLKLMDGRYFTQAEYEQSAKVCVVSERITGLLGLKVGDKVPFTVFRADGDLYDAENHTQIDEGDYEIVGIMSHDANYPFCVFLPVPAGKTEVRTVNGYSLGQFRLKNGEAAAFKAQVAPLLGQGGRGFRLHVYDQGYAAAMEPMEELLFISGLFLAACLLLAFCAMILQSYLFISRQRETAETMLALGSGRLRVCVYFLTGALLLVLLGAALGFAISREIDGWVFGVLKDFAAQFAQQDLRFSSTRLAIIRTLEFQPTATPESYLTAAVLLVGGSLIFTLLFTLACLRKKKAAKRRPVKQRTPKRAARVSRLSGFFKYALLSMRRGWARTAAVLLLGAAAALFFGRLTASLTGYREQLAAYKADAVITGSATDYYGKGINDLILYARPIANLSRSDLVTDCCVTLNLGHIKYLGVEGGEQIPFSVPQSEFAYEDFVAALCREPEWVGTNSVGGSPLVRGSGSVEWLEGWSDADFIRLEECSYDRWTGPAVCALSKSMMEENGIRLGDVINVVTIYDNSKLNYAVTSMTMLQFQVVASYVSPADDTTVYSPLTYLRADMKYDGLFSAPDSSSYLAPYQALGLSERLIYSSFTFTLTDTARLDELRDVMSDAGYTWVHSNDRAKSCAFIDDEVYLNTTHSMERQIQYVSVLYDALYVLAGVIGFTLAWLLLQSRRQEIAIMRALGTQPGRIVGNFLAEQLLLMTLGLGIGFAAGFLSKIPVCQTQLVLIAAFLGIWTLSTMICLIVGLRRESFAALTEPE